MVWEIYIYIYIYIYKHLSIKVAISGISKLIYTFVALVDEKSCT